MEGPEPARHGYIIHVCVVEEGGKARQHSQDGARIRRVNIWVPQQRGGGSGERGGGRGQGGGAVEGQGGGGAMREAPGNNE